MKTTNLNKIKDLSKVLFLAVPVTTTEIPFIIQHPFASNNLYVSVKETQDNPKIYDITKEDGYEIFKQETFEKIDMCKDLFEIIMLLNKSYYMTFFKIINRDLSEEDFSKLLCEFYTLQEWPNIDVNVSRKVLISYFKKANKKYLMTDDEYKKFEELKNNTSLTVYRGISHIGKPNGLSWTVDKNKAIWFAKRFSSNEANPKLCTMTIKNPNAILAYFDGRGEKEVIIDTFLCKDWSIENL